MESKLIKTDAIIHTYIKKRKISNVQQDELARKLPKRQENTSADDTVETINIDDDCDSVTKNSPQTEMQLAADAEHTFRRHLIACVRAHRVLYDKQHPNFGSDDAQAVAWRSIAKRLSADEINCRNVWANLRCEYQRYVRQLHRFLGPHNKSQATVKLRPCMRYEMDLLFLYRFIQPNIHIRKNKNHRGTLQKRLAINSSETVSVPTTQTEDDEDVVMMNYSGPVIIDLEAEEHRVLPFKINDQLRALAAIVRTYPELYDTEHRCYGNYRRRGIIWAGIAAELKDKATKLIKSWLQMLTRYEWEICIGYTPEHNDGVCLKPSPLQEMLCFIEPYIKRNTRSIFKQSRYLHIDWFETIDHFKSVVNLLDALENQPEFVQLIEDTLDKSTKPPQYDIGWRKVAEQVLCSAEQCEVTWLVMRTFFKELHELRKVGYYLQDKWYFENIIANLYKTVEKACIKPIKIAAPMEAIISFAAANSATQPVATTTQNQPEDHSYGKPVTITLPYSHYHKNSQEPCISTKKNTTATNSIQTSIDANQIQLAADQSKLNRKPATNKQLQVKPIASVPTTIVPRSLVPTTSISTSTISSLKLTKVPPNTTFSTVSTSTSITNSNEYPLPKIIGAVSLAPLISNTLPPPVLSTGINPTLCPLQPIPITLQAQRSAAPPILPPTLKGLTNTLPNKTNVSIRPARPLVTVSLRPKHHIPNSFMGNTATRSLFGSNSITSQNVYLQPINAAPNVFDNDQNAILQTKQKNYDTTRQLPSSSTNALHRPPLIRMPTLRPHVPNLISNDNFSNILAKVVPSPATTLTAIATPSTTATTKSQIPLAVSSPSPLLQPTAPAMMPLQPMVIVHAANTVSEPDTTNNPTTSQNSASVSTVLKMLTPTEIASTSALKITNATSILNPNEIMIELISCNNIKQLVVHGPPLPSKYSLSMSTTTNLIREITSIPWLFKKQSNHPPEILDRYWQYIARKYSLPVHVSKACWNFLADNISHFPEIAPMSELLKPIKNGLKIWETSHTLFQTFNTSALQQGWLNCNNLPELMILVRRHNFLYSDVRQSTPNVLVANSEKVKMVWNTARVLYPSIENPDAVWCAFKKVFVQYMDDLERAVDNPWPQNWWRVLEQLQFLIDTRYNPLDPFYYTVHKKFIEEVQRCHMYEQLMNNNTVETETPPPRCPSFTISAVAMPPASQHQNKQPSIIQEHDASGGINGFHFARALGNVPIIYEKNSVVEKRAAWLTLAGVLQTTVANCHLTLKKTLHNYLKYKARDTINRCYLNKKYYKHFGDIYRRVQYRGTCGVKKANELKKRLDGPIGPVHPECYVPEINMHTCTPTLVVKNWAYATWGLAQDELCKKLQELFDRYRAAQSVEVASTVSEAQTSITSQNDKKNA